MPEISCPALRFVEEPFHENEVNNTLLRFREQGYAVLRNVFVRESVDAFLEQVEGSLVKDEGGRLMVPEESPLLVWPAWAPRVRQVLPGALSHTAMKPHPSMFESAWLISEQGPPISADKGWHKDRDHEGMPGREYHYPRDVHLGFYLTDMTEEHGPTQVIPRSHMNPQLSPYSGAEVEQFLCRKEDVVLWDQRLWHRGTPRTVPGLRIFAIFGFYGVPVYHTDRRVMPEAQRQALLEATSPLDQVYFGGTFIRRDSE